MDTSLRTLWRSVSTLAVLAVLAFQGNVWAQSQATGTLSVSASVSHSCKGLSANALSFGSYNPVATTPTDGTTTFTVQCTTGTPVTVSLDKGLNGTSPTARKLVSGANTLNYALYSDAGRSTVWGDGATGGNTFQATGAGLNTNLSFTVYGRIPAQQLAAAVGTYSDTVTVTVSY